MISQGIEKVVAYVKEDNWGVAGNTANGRIVRRVTSSFNLTKDTYQSDEIRTDQQMADFRHGVRSVTGSLEGELSAGAYSEFLASAVRRNFAAGATTGAQVDIQMDATGGQIIRGAGSFLTDGFKVGDIVRASGFTTPANNDNNFFITAVTALALTFVVLGGTPAVDEAAGASVTVALAGQKTFVPETGHTDDSFTFEEYYSDIDQSEVFTGNKVESVTISLPPTGLSTISTSFMGKDLDAANSGTGQYFVSPTAPPCDGLFAAVNGALIVDGQVVALVTGLDFNINENLSMEPVVGSNLHPEIFRGRVLVDGSFSVFFEDEVFRDYFVNETEVSLAVALTASNEKNANAMSFVLPRIKINSADKDDGETGITQSHNFQALLACDGGTGTDMEKTTISIQDTTLV